MHQKALIIVNPVARRLPPRPRLEAAADWLVRHDWYIEIALTERPDHAIELSQRAAAEGYDVVVACGGDGTVNEVANGLAGSDTALSVIPGGTANIWAKEVGIPRDPLAAIAIVSHEARWRVDLGQATPLISSHGESPRRSASPAASLAAGQASSRYFLLMAGVGFDAQVIHALSPSLKRRVGAAAYVLAGLREGLHYRGQRATIDTDGDRREVDLLLMIAGNTRNYGGVASITANAFVDDGLLDICLFEGNRLSHILLHAVRGLAGRHLGAKRVTYRRVQRLTISSETPIWTQLDGDLFTTTPLSISVVPAGLTVCLPAGRHPAIFRS